MKVERLVVKTDAAIPLIAALPYAISADERTVESAPQYDAVSQMTVYGAGRNYSTCREDDSAGGIFSTKADTKRDD